MKKFLIGAAIVIGFFAVVIGLSYGFGWIGVHQTKTIGKAKQNAETEVFYETQAFVDGKKREALKFYQEYKAAGPSERESIEKLVSLSFANFDEDKLDEPLCSFIKKCKY